VRTNGEARFSFELRVPFQGGSRGDLPLVC